MAKFVVMLSMVLSLSTSVACTRVGAGYVGIKVNMSGSQKGVEDFPTTTGWVFYNPVSTQVFEYPTYMQTVRWTRPTEEGAPNEELTFNTGDQMAISADVAIAYSISPDKVPAFYVTFRNDDITTFSHGFLRNVTRDKFDAVAGKYKIEQIMSNNAAFMDEVRNALKTELLPYGVILNQLGFVGAVRPPAPVVAAINAKVQAQQIATQKETELLQVQADAAKVIAAADGEAQATMKKAEAEARANNLINNSLTPSLIEYERTKKWNGSLPMVTGGATPLINLPGGR